MANILERTPERLVMKSGSSTLVLDKSAGTATLQRKLLFVPLKPASVPFSEIADVTLDTVVDPASHAEIEHAMLRLRAGGAWALAADNKASAQAAIAAIREFIGLKS